MFRRLLSRVRMKRKLGKDTQKLTYRWISMPLSTKPDDILSDELILAFRRSQALPRLRGDLA